MRKILLTSAFFLCFGELSLHGSESDIEEENDQASIVRTFEDLSLEEQEAQNTKVLKMVQEAREVRKQSEENTLKRALIYDLEAPEELDSFFAAIRGAYDIVASPKATEEFRQNTDRVRRGLVALAANLHGQSVPFVNTSEGFTKEEWPEGEQDLWKGIQGFVSRSEGDYGCKKSSIQAFEMQLINLQKKRNNLKYIRFSFNTDLTDEDCSLAPDLRNYETDMADIQSAVSELSDSDATNKAELLDTLEAQLIWGKIKSIFILAMDRAQAEGWSNWSRTCFATAFVDLSTSFNLYKQRETALRQSASKAD